MIFFSNFINNYIAFNAPLVYEEEGNNELALQDHISRYRINKARAEYFYPIFSILEKEILLKWLQVINPFFIILSQNLSEIESKLITFYAPDFDENPFQFRKKFSYDMGFTFFLGNKKDDSELVCVYMHNHIYANFSSQESPSVTKYFVIRSGDDFERHKRFIQEERLRLQSNHMRKMNLEGFLEYCEKLINILESS